MYIFLQESCNKELEWFEAYKSNLGSMEENAIERMENILKYGVYVIGSPKRKIFVNVDDIFQLKVLPEGSQDNEPPKYKNVYGLEEVRDLESKLVLITGSKADHRVNFKLFFNVSFTLSSLSTIDSIYQETS